LESFEEQDRCFETKIKSFVPSFKTELKVLKSAANAEGLGLGAVDRLGSKGPIWK